MKRKKRSPTAEPTMIEIIDQDESDGNNPGSKTHKKSWVGNYFKVSKEIPKVICQVTLKGKRICATKLRRDKSGTASERVFSKGHKNVSWQQSSLNPQSIEQILCLKGW